MKADMYYREEYPKELRLTLEHPDELRFLRLLFSRTPRHILNSSFGQELIKEEKHLCGPWVRRMKERRPSKLSDTVRDTDEVFSVTDDEIWDEEEK